MRNSNSFGVHFIVKPNKISTDGIPIYARISVDSQRVEVSMKMRVEPGQWNHSRGMAKGNKEEIREVNAYLEKVRSTITADYQELRLAKKHVTAETLKSRFLGEDRQDMMLSQLLEYHNTEFTGKLRQGTLKNYITTARYLEKFVKKKYKREDYCVRDIDFSFVQAFEIFLRRHRPTDHQRPMNQNGVMKHMERFQKLMGLARDMEWISKSPFDRYRLKFEKVEIDYLTEFELEQITSKVFANARLSWVQDIFVFACYTGLAYTDLSELTPSSVYKGVDGEPWLSGKRKKTSEPFHIPLLYPALNLIEKYRDHEKSKAKGTLLPVPSNQRLNTYLKEIADLCGISKNLTFHVARHTFATTVTLLNGVPIESVSKMLGHSRLSTTQVYGRVIQKKLSQDMASLREKLAPKSIPTVLKDI